MYIKFSIFNDQYSTLRQPLRPPVLCGSKSLVRRPSDGSRRPGSSSEILNVQCSIFIFFFDDPASGIRYPASQSRWSGDQAAATQTPLSEERGHITKITKHAFRRYYKHKQKFKATGRETMQQRQCRYFAVPACRYCQSGFFPSKKVLMVLISAWLFSSDFTV